MRSEIWIGVGAALVVGFLGSFVALATLLALLISWLLVGLIAWLRTRHPDPEMWLRGAAIFTSALAGAIFFQAARDAASPLGALPVGTQAGFHLAVAGGLGFMLIVLVFYFAWKPVRHGEGWALTALLAGGLPAIAVIGAAIGAELVTWRHTYGSIHVSVWMLPALWLSATGALARGAALKKRASDRAGG
ncbi:MAG: hypothetical protein HYU54_02965 [Actinobacteria bacterium]|nr:hypothetical protein [Actinomycetota bacterium]